MLTDYSSRPGSIRSPEPGRSTARTIMIVNGDDQAVQLLDAVLEAGRYDVVFVESAAHAYSQVRRLQPNLVVVCTRLGEMDGFQVLSMLKLDEQTRSIPVLTYATDVEGADPADESEEADGMLEASVGMPAGRLN